MATKRGNPAEAARKRAEESGVDSNAMDPEMQATLRGEGERRIRVKTATTPWAQGVVGSVGKFIEGIKSSLPGTAKQKGAHNKKFGRPA